MILMLHHIYFCSSVHFEKDHSVVVNISNLKTHDLYRHIVCFIVSESPDLSYMCDTGRLGAFPWNTDHISRPPHFCSVPSYLDTTC